MTPRLILAPLLGVTGHHFRGIHHRLCGGFDEAMAPFIAVTHGKQPPASHFKDIDPLNNQAGVPLVPQLIGKDGADFRETANRIHEEFGYPVVNWNIGCPAGTVTARLRGAGMLAHPEMIERFLDEACPGLHCRLSVKMRLGMESPEEYLALAPILNRYPIAEITIHPRTGRQQYTGKADVGHFARLKSLLVHPIVYNGDITSRVRFEEIRAQFGDLAGIMVGRGAIRDPWLPRRIAEGLPDPPAMDYAGLRGFHDAIFAAYLAGVQGGARPVLGRMKELWTYWEAHWPEEDRRVRQVLRTETIEDYRQMVDRAFAAKGVRP